MRRVAVLPSSATSYREKHSRAFLGMDGDSPLCVPIPQSVECCLETSVDHSGVESRCRHRPPGVRSLTLAARLLLPFSWWTAVLSAGLDIDEDGGASSTGVLPVSSMDPEVWQYESVTGSEMGFTDEDRVQLVPLDELLQLGLLRGKAVRVPERDLDRLRLPWLANTNPASAPDLHARSCGRSVVATSCTLVQLILWKSGISMAIVLVASVRASSLPDDVKKQVIITEALPPRLHGLPKIHKRDIPLRPIVSAIGAPTYLLAKHLTTLLQPYIDGKTELYSQFSTLRGKTPEGTIQPGRYPSEF
ncbi:hypothetical protein Trydic_g22808 [Trypoxylus dichotomus]